MPIFILRQFQLAAIGIVLLTVAIRLPSLPQRNGHRAWKRMNVVGSIAPLQIAQLAVDSAIRYLAFHDPHGTFKHLYGLKGLKTEIVRGARALIV